MRKASGVLAGLLVASVVLFQPTPVVAASDCGTDPDFNGDGFPDLALGVPGEDVGGFGDAGAVHIIYGSSTGLTTTGNEIFHQDSSGMADNAATFEQFGFSLSACDFDADGRDDLAIGVPRQTVGADVAAGAVHIIYGSSAGLTASGDQVFHQDTSGMADDAEGFEAFGRALAAGDFDGDGRGDLGIGVPFQDVGGGGNDGVVHVLYGTSTGLSVSGDQVFHQDTSGMAGEAEDTDLFGQALTAGDFDGDGRDDLGVGVPAQVVGGDGDAGAVHVIYGSSAGLSASGDQVFHRDTSGIAGETAAGEVFGRALGSGDFDGDGRDDLGVGVPFQTVGGDFFAGAVHVIYGSSTGLSASGDQVFHQDTSGMADEAEEVDNFGRALTVGDFDGDGRDDLGVGVPLQTVSGESRAGAVHAIYGTSAGLSASGDQVFQQDTSGMADQAEEFENFGGAVGAADFDGDGRSDLVAGIERQNLPPEFNDEGAVHVVYGSAVGLTASGDQFLHRLTDGIVGEPVGNAYFGGTQIGSPFQFFDD